MKFADSFIVPTGKAITWAFASDIPEILRCLPGCESVQEIGEDRFRIELSQKLGPFTIAFDIEADAERDEAGHRIRATGQGRDRGMGNTLSFVIELQVQNAADGSQVRIDSDVQVRGPAAQLGFGVMQHKARETFETFARNVKAELESRREDPS